jgi:hypothetical protein
MARSDKGLYIFIVKILDFEFFHNLLDVQKWFDKILFQRFELDFFLKLEYRIHSFGLYFHIVFSVFELIPFLSWNSTGDGIDDCEFGFLPFGQTEIGEFLDHGAVG